jgi:hypothetical protein
VLVETAELEEDEDEVVSAEEDDELEVMGVILEVEDVDGGIDIEDEVDEVVEVLLVLETGGGVIEGLGLEVEGVGVEELSGGVVLETLDCVDMLADRNCLRYGGP